jgi:hypothetical protein
VEGRILKPAIAKLAGLSLTTTVCTAGAQEIEPRAYSPTPVGMNFLVLSLANSSGGLSVDPTVPLDNVEADLNVSTVGYMHTFGLFGRSASASIGLPYVWGDVSGDVFEQRRSIRRSGLGDARARFTVNLFGAPALDPKEFAAATRSTQVGLAFTVSMPTGEYDSQYLINIGANRWAVKPEIGIYQPLGRWSFEFAAGAWFFQDNDDFFGGARRGQDPVSSLQAHVGYTFKPRLWVAADYAWYRGGASTLDGVEKADLQQSTRVGLVASFPLGQHQSVKLAWSDGVTTRIGADFTTYTLTWQLGW